MYFARVVLIAVLVIGFFNVNFAGLEGDFMSESITWAQGVGLSDGTRPDEPATRQKVVTMMYRLYAVCTGLEPPIFDDSGGGDDLPFTPEEMEILYRIAWAEARGEDDKGLILVINVIINRMNDPAFPNDVRGVVFAPNQFSPITNGAFDRATPDDRIRNAVHRALQGEDYSRGATFFRSVRGAEGSWHERALNRVFTHGNHHFYVSRG